MSLVDIYVNQYRWRRWSTVYPYLRDLSAADVLDLGCGIGDQARDLSRLGARVVGVDANQDVIDHAASRGIPDARFFCDNVTSLAGYGLTVDGVWASFAAAYFPQFDVMLRAIDNVLKPGGWLALTEVDDLLGHRPLVSRWVALVEQYYARSLEQGRYRFRSHDHVLQVLGESGWRIELERSLEDDEFSFVGAAPSDVLEAWETRLGFMIPQFLQRFGSEATGFDSAFLSCLRSEEHRSESRVWFILARTRDDGRDAGQQQHAADGSARRR
jgi:SAM-dependent methyltransferase